MSSVQSVRGRLRKKGSMQCKGCKGELRTQRWVGPVSPETETVGELPKFISISGQFGKTKIVADILTPDTCLECIKKALTELFEKRKSCFFKLGRERRN